MANPLAVRVAEKLALATMEEEATDLPLNGKIFLEPSGFLGIVDEFRDMYHFADPGQDWIFYNAYWYGGVFIRRIPGNCIEIMQINHVKGPDFDGRIVKGWPAREEGENKFQYKRWVECL